MSRKQNNYAFIDGQNTHKGVQSLGWKIDWFRFRIYLREKYHVEVAYVFIGFMVQHNALYEHLQKAGFILKFKPVLPDRNGKPKGNVDADLVLQAMLDYSSYDQAVLVSSDGDFYSLVEHWYSTDKLKMVLSPYIKTCSTLLKKTAKEKIIYLDTVRPKISQKKSTA
ncbi:MAG TPA: NYN domain-containing protein [Candidatus Paceibacterota bacterium]|nr:NYN domain-containing protein [Candidatus Paceibacterota bacterium]